MASAQEYYTTPVSGTWTNYANAWDGDTSTFDYATTTTAGAQTIGGPPGTRTNFGAIPAGATISGILVEVYAYGDADDYLTVGMSYDGTNFTTGKTVTPGTGAGWKTLGGSTDTWGRTWAESEIDTANFKCRITYTNTTKANTMYVGSVRVTVYYVLKAATSSTLKYSLRNMVLEGGDTASDIRLLLRMDDGSGSTATDESGYNNDGSITDMLWSTDEKFGTHSINGNSATTGVINCGNDSSLEIPGDVTFTCWLKLNSFGTYPTRYAQKMVSYYCTVRIGNDSSGVVSYGRGDGATIDYTDTGSNLIPTGVWVFLAITDFNKDVTIYFDCVEKGTGSYTLTPDSNSSPLYIGNTGSLMSLDGLIDEVRLYARALTLTELQLIMNSNAYATSGARKITPVYNIRNMVQPSKATIVYDISEEAPTNPLATVGLVYNVRSTVDVVQDSVYNVRGWLPVISTDVIYHIKNGIQTSAELQYHIAGVLVAVSNILYNVRDLVSADSELRYHIRETVSSTVSEIYNILNYSGATIASLVYHLYAYVPVSVVLKYNLRNLMSAASTKLVYDILFAVSSITASCKLAYDLYGSSQVTESYTDYGASSNNDNAWTDPQNAYGTSDDDTWSTCAPGPNATVDGDWAGYGITGATEITKVEIIPQGHLSATGTCTMHVLVSWDGGSTWGTDHTKTDCTTSDQDFTVDVTSDTAWTWTKLGLLEVRIGAQRTGSGFTVYLDRIVVRVYSKKTRVFPSAKNLLYNIEEAVSHATATIGVVYDIRNTVAGITDQIYNILERTSARSGLVYNILSQLSASSSIAYSIRGIVDSSNTIMWSIRNQLAATSTHLWNIRSLSSAVATVEYNLLSTALASATILYGVRNSRASVVSLIYSIGGPVLGSVSFVYNIINEISVSTNFTLLYNVRGLSVAGMTAVYNIKNTISSARVIVYSILGSLGVATTLSWRIRNLLTTDAALWYNILGSTYSATRLVYGIRNTVKSTDTVIYNILSRLEMATTLSWGIRNLRTTVVAIKYNIFGFATATVRIVYTIGGALLALLGVVYNIRNSRYAVSSLRYNIRSLIGSESTLVYGLRSFVTATRTILYDVYATLARTVVFAYNVRERSETSVRVVWNIFEGVLASVGYLWDIFSRTARSVVLRWKLNYTLQNVDPYMQLFNEVRTALEAETVVGGSLEGFRIYSRPNKNQTLYFPCVVLDMERGDSQYMFGGRYNEGGTMTIKLMFTRKSRRVIEVDVM